MATLKREICSHGRWLAVHISTINLNEKGEYKERDQDQNRGRVVVGVHSAADDCNIRHTVYMRRKSLLAKFGRGRNYRGMTS